MAGKNYNLNEQQKKFIEEYFVNGKSTAQAAMAAGYADNERVGRSVGSRVLRCKSVKQYMVKCGIKVETPKTNRAHLRYVSKKMEYEAEAKKEDLEKQVKEAEKEREEIRQRENKLVNMFEWKVERLKQIVDESLGAPDIGNISNDEIKKQYGPAIAAIAELNKMQGHYSPVKSVNIDLRADADMLKLKELSNKLLLEYKSEIMNSGGELY